MSVRSNPVIPVPTPPTSPACLGVSKYPSIASVGVGAGTTRHCMTQQSRPPALATHASHHDPRAAVTCDECARWTCDGAFASTHG